MPVKPPHPAGDSQTTYIKIDLSHSHSDIFSALVGSEPVRNLYVFCFLSIVSSPVRKTASQRRYIVDFGVSIDALPHY